MNNDQLVRLLDENSKDSSRRSSFTWDTLYSAAFRFLQLEGSKILSDASKVIVTTSGGSQSKAERAAKNKLELAKNSAFSFINAVIRKSNHSEPMLKGTLLVNDMISLLRLDQGDMQLRRIFGADALQILLKHVFPIPKYVAQISVGLDGSKNDWKTLLQIAFDVFLEIPDGN